MPFCRRRGCCGPPKKIFWRYTTPPFFLAVHNTPLSKWAQSRSTSADSSAQSCSWQKRSTKSRKEDEASQSPTRIFSLSVWDRSRLVLNRKWNQDVRSSDVVFVHAFGDRNVAWLLLHRGPRRRSAVRWTTDGSRHLCRISLQERGDCQVRDHRSVRPAGFRTPVFLAYSGHQTCCLLYGLVWNPWQEHRSEDKTQQGPSSNRPVTWLRWPLLGVWMDWYEVSPGRLALMTTTAADPQSSVSWYHC